MGCAMLGDATICGSGGAGRRSRHAAWLIGSKFPVFAFCLLGGVFGFFGPWMV
jgi:hypothetical protein